jgi:hypothetical protein
MLRDFLPWVHRGRVLWVQTTLVRQSRQRHVKGRPSGASLGRVYGSIDGRGGLRPPHRWQWRHLLFISSRWTVLVDVSFLRLGDTLELRSFPDRFGRAPPWRRRPMPAITEMLAGTPKKNEVVGLFAGDAIDLMVDDALANDMRAPAVLPGQPQA